MRGGRGGFNKNAGGRGGGNRGGFGGGRGGGGRFDKGGRNFDNGNQVEVGTFHHLANGTAVYALSTKDGHVPLTQTFLFNDRKEKVGKIGDVYGPLTEVYFNCVPEDEKFLNGLKEGDKIYAPEDRLKPESFFVDDAPKPRGGGRGGARGGRGGGGRGGRGGGRGGRGGRF